MKSNKLYKLLLKDGWKPQSQKGSHVKLVHKTKGLLVFPMHGSKEVGKGLEKKNYETDKHEIMNWKISIPQIHKSFIAI